MKPTPLDLRREDYPDLDGPRLDKMLRALNTSVGSLVNILSGGFLFPDNGRAFIKDLEIRTRDAWIPLSLQNGWAASSGAPSPAYHMDSAGNVHFRGAIEGGSYSTTLRIGQVAAEYRPEVAKSRIIESQNSGGAHFPAYVTIDTDGSLYPHAGSAGTYLELAGISYHAEGKDAPNPVFPISFKNTLGAKPVGVIVLRAVDLSSQTESPIRVTSPAWSTSGDQIVVHNIAGLPSNGRARVTVLVIGG